MITERLHTLLRQRPSTLLGVGPMSTSCIDASIELANEYDIPILLIASRRQIDSEEFGGGYVNNWTTDQFTRYVLERDKNKNIILARDHGGPWQNKLEIQQQLSTRDAMESAKASYRADIDAGIQVLHIDPSIDPHGIPDNDQVLNRLFELYEYCWTYAQATGKEVIFEIGTEEQSGTTNTKEQFEYTINATYEFCQANSLPKPTFVVIQSGTRVMEMRNVGSFDIPVRVSDELPPDIQVPMMIEICNKLGILMKEHNADYLSDKALRWHPRLGIHAANVAPEFGVTETKALVSVLESNSLQILSDRFLQLAFDSNKWDKWMLHNTSATDRDRSLIAGHYIFSTPECCELIKQASIELALKGVNLQQHLKDAVKHSIRRYLQLFRLVDYP